MNRRFSLALLLPAAVLIGCTLPSTTPNSPIGTTPTGSWENWQIQAGTAITSPPNTYPSFLGAIQIQGNQASGIFTTVYPPGTPTPGTTVQDYAGSFVSSTGNVTLATYGFAFDYTQPITPYTVVPVSVIGGCVYPPTYTGAECNAIFAVPSVGVQIAPLNGTYSGPLTDINTSLVSSGEATLTLRQSATPNTDGSFALTATLTFIPVSGSGTDSLTGSVAGEGMSLSYCSAAVVGPCVSVTAATNPAATQIIVSSLVLTDPGMNINATFTGALILQ